MDVLSAAYWGLGQFDASSTLYESALVRSKEVYGSTHDNSLDLMLKAVHFESNERGHCKK